MSMIAASVLLVFPVFSHNVFADASPTDATSSLQIVYIKITTTDQFIVLYNRGETDISLQDIRLQYFNSVSPADASSNRLIALPGHILPHGYYVVNDGSFAACFAAQFLSASLGFSTTSGSLQVSRLATTDDGATNVTGYDSVRWVSSSTKTAPAGAQKLFDSKDMASFLARPTSGNVWDKITPDSDDQCAWTRTTVSANIAAPEVVTASVALPGDPPQADILPQELDAETSDDQDVAPKNVGLNAPVITELLPNPNAPGTDAEDEFIELYNGNDQPFGLGGYKLQTGLTTKRTFTFASGTSLAPKEYKSFYSADTGLSLSNNGSQVALVDPAGNQIAQTAAYGLAKQGQAWALAAPNDWRWTTSVTPNAKNAIKTPTTTTKAKTKTTTTTSAALSSAKSVPILSAVTKTAKSSVAAPTSNATTDQTGSTIHPAVLVSIGVFAVLYGLYE